MTLRSQEKVSCTCLSMFYLGGPVSTTNVHGVWSTWFDIHPVQEVVE